MATNVFTTLPKSGDAVVGVDGKVKFICKETYNESALSSSIERIGSVICRRGQLVKIAWKGGYLGLYQWTDRACWKVGSPALSTDAHTWTIRQRVTKVDSDGKKQAVITFTPAGTSLTDYITALNAAFADSSQMGDLYALDFFAYEDNGILYIEHDFTYYKQQLVGTYINGVDSEQGLYIGSDVEASLGLAFSEAPESGYFYDHSGAGEYAMMKCGRNTKLDGCIGNIDRALAYFKTATSDWLTVSTDITKLSESVPMRLSTYQGEHCQFLRDTYEPEDGDKAAGTEKGWERYMRSLLPVRPCDWGVMSDNIDGVKACANLRGVSLATNQKTDGATWKYPIFHQVDVATANSVAIPASRFYVPTPADLMDIEAHLDDINTIVEAMGGAVLVSSRSLWSCLRRASNTACCYGGSGGMFNGGSSVMLTGGLLPVSLYKLP